MVSQCVQNKIGALIDRDFGKQNDRIAERRIESCKPVKLGDSCIKIVLPLSVLAIDLSPGRREKNDRMIAVMSKEAIRLTGIAGRQGKGRICVDQSPVKKDPARLSFAPGFAVPVRQFDSPAGEGLEIDPRQGFAFSRQFLSNDSATGFFDNGKAAR